MTLYTSKAVDDLADWYIENDGEIYTIEDGSLLQFGLGIFIARNLKTAIVKEVYLNEWSSAYTIRLYNKCPKKYQEMLERV